MFPFYFQAAMVKYTTSIDCPKCKRTRNLPGVASANFSITSNFNLNIPHQKQGN